MKRNEHDGRIAVRAYAVPEDYKKPRRGRNSRKPWPTLTLIFECSTRDDVSKRLTHGSYLVLNGQRVIDRGFFYGDDLPKEEISQLEQHCSTRNKEIVKGKEKFRLLARERFVREVFLKVGYRARGVVVGLNLPFQISRIAVDWAEARAEFYRGGFSFTLLKYEDQYGIIRPHAFAPRIAIKSIDGRRALIGFTSAWQQDPKLKEDTKDKRAPFRGHFVDCRVLAYALSGSYFDLKSARDYFDVPTIHHPLNEATSAEHFNFQNLESGVVLISKLYQKLVEDFSKHPISLLPSQAYSAASIGKGYLRDIGIKPPTLVITKGIGMTSEDVLGASMVSYYGGRAECRIRDVALPVTYVDFLSMYPTIHTLLGLGEFKTTKTIKVEDWTQETIELLEKITPEDLFKQSTWKSLSVLVKVLPKNDIFPIRTKYSKYSQGSYSLAVNEITSSLPLWYTLADCIASKLITGRAPDVVEAIRFTPKGEVEKLKSVNILRRHEFDPREDDFFKALVEQRNELKRDVSLDPALRNRLNYSLKSIVSASGYGIFIELNRQEGKKATVEVHGLETFSCKVESPEEPGEFFFPIIGTLLTGGARLMLALLECEIARRGGSYVFMDTDSAAIVATKDGGLIPCPGGAERLLDGSPAIKALSWAEVDEILALFDQLNPYDRDFVPSGILKLEDENFINGDHSNERIELKCLSISSKRYALFYKDERGIHIHKASEHSLGNYLTPINRETGQEVHNWIEHAWRMIILVNSKLKPQHSPMWLNEFVLTRIQLSTPKMIEWVKPLNVKIEDRRKGMEKHYESAIKPFNSIEHILLSSFSFKKAEDDQQVCLISPASGLLPLQRSWINLHDPDGALYWIASPKRSSWGDHLYPGRTYLELINRHNQQPESKFLSVKKEPCSWMSKGMLLRRHIRAVDVIHIGKEANEIDKVQAGLIDSEDEVLLTYERDLWEVIQPILNELPFSLIQERTGYRRSMIYALRKGDRRPSSDRLQILLALVAKHARERLVELGSKNLGLDDRMAVIMYGNLLRKEDKD